VIQHVGTALIVVSALLSVACVVAHQVLARWWETPVGRHVFAFEAVLAACLGLWALRLALPEGDWFEVPRLVAFAGVPLVLGWRLLIILRVWGEERRRRMEGN
jgi:hypothetical protein